MFIKILTIVTKSFMSGVVMRSYEEITRMTNTTVQQAAGATREQAVIDALTFYPNRF